jgi:hypothetical protein
MISKSVIPAKAGIPLIFSAFVKGSGAPAFAEVTIKGKLT